MKKYHVYGIGAAIVDTEVIVSEDFLKKNEIDKGLMTLVDEERQGYLIDSLTTQRIPVKRSCGGSACNTVVAASRFGSKAFFSGKVADDDDGSFFVKDLNRAGVVFHQVQPSSGVTGNFISRSWIRSSAKSGNMAYPSYTTSTVTCLSGKTSSSPTRGFPRRSAQSLSSMLSP